MLENKQKTTILWKTLCVLAALMLGALLGSPASKPLTESMAETVSKITIQAVKMQYLHSEETTPKVTAPFQETTMQSMRELIAQVEHTDSQSQSQHQGEEEADQSVDSVQNEDAIQNEETNQNSEAIQSGDLVSEAFAPQESSFSAPANTASGDFITNVNRGGSASRKEVDVLIHLINAEAYGLSYKAKVAVGQVVMNRWKGPHYGDDLLAIMTAPHQFTPIHNGSAYKKKIEPDSIQAAYAVLSGTGVPELTDDTYYFVNPDFTKDKTIETKMQFVCEMEGIHFFKPPAK